MRILYFSRNYTPHDFRFLNSLSKTEHEIFYLKLETNQRQMEDRPVPESVQQVHWSGGQHEFRWHDLLRLVLDFRCVVKRIKPDIVHAGPIQTCAFIATLGRFHPVLTMSWGFDLMDDVHKGWIWEFATRYTLKRSAFFTSDVNVTRDKAVAYGMNPDKTIIFPWGVDLHHFNVSSTNRKSKEPFTLFCNRAWEPRYGVDVLAKAFVKVASVRPDVYLMLLGGGTQGVRIRQILTNNGVMERVHFGGQVAQRDLPRWYHQADIYISPSRVDGSSVSLMEALACGMPCLVSDIPGNKEWIEDGVNGWLFRDGDADDLAEKILSAIKSRRSFGRIGKAARQTAEERADWKKNFGKLLEAYTVIVRER